MQSRSRRHFDAGSAIIDRGTCENAPLRLLAPRSAAPCGAAPRRCAAPRRRAASRGALPRAPCPARTGGRNTVSQDASIYFLRPGTNTEKLTAKGRVIKAGRTTGLAEAEVFTDDGKLIAKAEVTVHFIEGPIV